MTLEEKKKQAEETLSHFAEIIDSVPVEMREEILRDSVYAAVQKTILKNYLGDKAALAKKICDNMADFIRHSIYGCPKEQ